MTTGDRSSALTGLARLGFTRLAEADASLGLRWSVVESLPVHESIKLGEGNLAPLFDHYRQSLRNLAKCGVDTVCYNFMPILDWTRTELAHALPGGGTALRFNATDYAAFDCYMLQRPGAEAPSPLPVTFRNYGLRAFTGSEIGTEVRGRDRSSGG